MSCLFKACCREGNRLRILQINSVCGTGSTGRITTDLYRTLKEQGHECLIAYGRGKAPGAYQTLRIGTRLEVCLHGLYARIMDRSGFASRSATRRFLKKVAVYQPDIIHLHNLHGYYIHIELLFQYLKRAGIPVIWSLYDCWSFTGHCCHFDYIGCDRWKTGCCHCRQGRTYPKSLLWDNSRGNYLKKKSIFTGCPELVIVTPTRWLTDLVQESFLKSYSVVTIPSGIDLTAFKPTPSGLRSEYGLEGKYIVLGLSNGFDRYKGLSHFIRLAESLPEEYKLILVGVKGNKKEIPKNILALPRTKSSTLLAAYYTAADIFVNPTLQETQGLTNLEALACGTGVVAFHSGGCPESLTKDCGLIVDRGDQKGLKEAVMRACRSPFDPDSCRQRAKLYDKIALNQDYIRLYEESMYFKTHTDQSNVSKGDTV